MEGRLNSPGSLWKSDTAPPRRWLTYVYASNESRLCVLCSSLKNITLTQRLGCFFKSVVNLQSFSPSKVFLVVPQFPHILCISVMPLPVDWSFLFGGIMCLRSRRLWFPRMLQVWTFISLTPKIMVCFCETTRLRVYNQASHFDLLLNPLNYVKGLIFVWKINQCCQNMKERFF